MTATELDIPRFETVRVVNVGETTFEGWFNRHLYRIPPGKGVFVPRGFVNVYLGDWELDDDPRRYHKRKDEWERLVCRYSGQDAELWEKSVPHLEAFDLDGNRLMTVLDDPEGIHVNPASTTIAEQETLQAEVARLKNQLDNVMQLLNRDEMLAAGPDADPDAEQEVPEDEPAYAKPRGQSGAGERARSMREKAQG